MSATTNFPTPNFDAALSALLSDASASAFAKGIAAKFRERDPVDMLNDLELLLTIAQQRYNAISIVSSEPVLPFEEVTRELAARPDTSYFVRDVLRLFEGMTPIDLLMDLEALLTMAKDRFNELTLSFNTKLFETGDLHG